MKIYHVELTLCQKIYNWAQLVIISFSSTVRVAKHCSKIQNIFVGFSEIMKKIIMKTGLCQKLLSYPSVDEC